MSTGDTYAALQVLISVLVVSCPCAIGVAWPLNDELAASALRKHGVFLREPGLWHRIARVRKILFDKTGTLTLEHLGLRNPEVLETLGAAQRAILYRMVEGSLHPVSRCLRQYLFGIEGVANTGTPSHVVEEVAGRGLEARTDDGLWRLGRPDWAEPGADRSGEADGRDCAFTLNGTLLSAFRLAEEVREDAREEISRWRERGFEVFILSGDRREKVRAMGRRLGLPEDHGIGEMSPEDKADWIRQIDNRDTLMIGDGANDSLAFDATWCRGTPAVDKGLLEQKADFFFLGKGLGGIRSLFETAGRRRRTLRRVFTFTVFYNVMTLSLCLAGKMNPLLAAVLMPLSSLISVASVWIQRPR
jgi:P-type Cu2+ transporter